VKTLALAEAAVTACDADEALALVTRERSLLLRFADTRPTQATAVDDVTVEIAALVDGQLGRALTNETHADALRDCGARAATAARAAAHTATSSAYPGFPGAGAARPHRGHDARTAELDPALGGAALAETFAVAEHHGVAAHGIWTAAETERAIATSGRPGGAGPTGAIDRSTDALMKVICVAPSGRSGYATAMGVGVSALSPGRLAETAAAKALVAGEVAELPPGEYPVVLEPRAVGCLLELLGATALDGLAHAEGRGAFVDRLGDLVAAPAINLADSPFFRATLPRAFDAEGTPKRPLPLIQDGVARAVVHDVRSAALAGASSTGHAVEPGGGLEGPRPLNLVLAGGGAADLDELCAPIERGVYVTRFWYENVVRPKETLVTAVTRDGTFLIEDGRVSRPLRDLRITDTLLRILSRVQALTAQQRLTSEGDFYARRNAYGAVAPALRAGALRFNGATG
jgi:predicted Zn-dependent protease